MLREHIKRSCTSLGIVLLGAMVTACGGGGGEGDSAPRTQQGVFLDGVVEGMSYGSGSLSGTTDASGMFRYEEGATVTFKIGDIVIGTAPGASIMTPISLVPGASDETDPVVTNIVRFLLSIDDDGDPETGIQITAAMHAAAAGLELDFTSATFASDPATTDALAALTDASSMGARPLVSSAFAQAHFKDTLLRTMAGIYNGTFTGDNAGTWTIVVADDGSITGSGCSTVSGLGFTVSGTVSSSGDGAFGTGGSASFEGTFDLGGNFSGTWSDSMSADTGTFTGAKASTAVGGMEECGGGGGGGGGDGTDGTVAITGADTGVMGSEFTPVYQLSSSVLDMTSVIFSDTRPPATGPDVRILGVIVRAGAPVMVSFEKSGYYYVADCVAGADCSGVSVDLATNTVTLDRVVLVADPDEPDNLATGSLTLDGSLSFGGGG